MKSVELEGRQSLSPPDVVALEEGSLSLERGSPWMTSFVIENPPKEVSLKTKSHGQDQQIHAEMETTSWRRLASEAKGSCGRKTSEQAKGFFTMCFVS